MKRIIFILTFVSVAFLSCSEYQKVLKSTSMTDKMKYAEKLYKDKEYTKAIRIYEQLPSSSGRANMERVAYMYANSHYLLDKKADYLIASYLFKQFYQNYPDSQKAPEAMFKSGKGLYVNKPKHQLDQEDTYDAISTLQQYIDIYLEEIDNIKEANSMIRELNQVLEQKAFEIAKLYELIGYYPEAIKSFDLFVVDHPGGSRLKEETYFYRLRALYKWGKNSVSSKLKPRLLKAKKVYEQFKKYYPNTKYLSQIEEINKLIEKELEKT